MYDNSHGAASRSVFITSLKHEAAAEIARALPNADLNTQRKYRARAAKHINDIVTPLVWAEAKTSPESRAGIALTVLAYVRATIDYDKEFAETRRIVGDGRNLDFVDFMTDAHTMVCEDRTPEGIAKAADMFHGTLSEVAEVAIDLAHRAARGDRGRVHAAKVYAGRVQAMVDDIRDVFIEAMEAEDIDELQDCLELLEFTIKAALLTNGYGALRE